MVNFSFICPEPVLAKRPLLAFLDWREETFPHRLERHVVAVAFIVRGEQRWLLDIVFNLRHVEADLTKGTILAPGRDAPKPAPAEESKPFHD